MLLHRLALRLGRTVAELRASLGTDELAAWFAFDRLSPVGDERQDYALARLCLLVCELMGAKRRGGGAVRLEDFLLWKLPEPEKTPLEAMRGWVPKVLKGPKPRRT